MVSIVTVVYNAFGCIERTLGSVQSQTYTNYEYIIIDGGSTDGTLNVINSYQSIISYLVSEKDNGVYDAMNKGVRMCNGEWVVFMNAGDTFASNHTLDDIFGGSKNYDNVDAIYGDVLCCYSAAPLIIKAQPLDNLKYRMAFCHQSSFVRTDLLRDNPFDLKYKYVADYDFFHKMYIYGKSFRYLPVVLANYYPEGGLTNRNILNVMREENKISGIRDFKWFVHYLYTYNSYFLHSVIPVKVLNILRGKFHFDLR